MTGTVEHMSLADVRRNSSSSQSRLSSFGTSQTTYVGVVRSASDDFEEQVDEMVPELAPPESLFYQWLQTRESLENEGMPHVQAHNEALDRVDYRTRFEDHLNSDEAQYAIESIADRVADGEHVVLVCYCGESKWCHREMVFERVKSLVEKQINA